MVTAIDAELRGLGGLPPDQALFRLVLEVSRRPQASPGPGGDDPPDERRPPKAGVGV